MSSRIPHARLVLLGALLSPGAGLALAMIASGLPGPSSARASSKNPRAEFAQLPEHAALNDSQRLLVRFLDRFEADAVQGSPFYMDPRRTDDPESLDEEPIVEVAPPRVEVSSIIGGPHPVAVIEGTLHSIGDEIGNGWVLSEIDPDGPMIAFRHVQSGQTYTLHLRDRR
ncbi:MAG: hypothetical protein H6811_10800 [Phycisphaeraceae bacterium]|nr:hypothetical protein [Phycisphaeraceae bacterium]